MTQTLNLTQTLKRHNYLAQENMTATDDQFSATQTAPTGLGFTATRILLIAMLGLICATGTCPAATEALISIVANGVDAVVPGGGAGFAFQSASNLSVMALGYHIDSSTTQTDERVELLDASGNILAATNIDLNTPQTNQFRYWSIPPVFLPAGSTNFIVAYDWPTYLATGQKRWAGITVVRDTPSTAWFDVSLPLVYLGYAQGSNLFPNSTNFLFYGANFQFGPPIRRPFLQIALVAPNQAELYWPTQATGFTLQATTDLISAPMTNVPTPPVISGTNYAVFVTRSGPQVFYRLYHPPQ